VKRRCHPALLLLLLFWEEISDPALKTKPCASPGRRPAPTATSLGSGVASSLRRSQHVRRRGKLHQDPVPRPQHAEGCEGDLQPHDLCHGHAERQVRLRRRHGRHHQGEPQGLRPLLSSGYTRNGDFTAKIERKKGLGKGRGMKVQPSSLRPAPQGDGRWLCH